MRSLSCAVFAAALLVAMPAFADPSPQDISQARDLGQQAQAALDAGNYAESEKLWTAAANLLPTAPTLTLGLARSQVKQGKFVLAKETYTKIIREQSANANASQAFKDALAAAQSEINDASAKIAHVTITIEGGPPNTVVVIDNDTLPPSAIGVPRPVDPGQHKVKASAEGYAPAETTFNVVDAGNADAKLTLTKMDAAPLPAPPPFKDAAPPAESGKRDHTFAAIAFGVGGVGLVLGGITGLLALGKHSDLEKECTATKCANKFQGDVDSFHTMATLSTVGFIVAGVGAAAGAVLWFTAPKKEAQAASWHPYVGVGGGGIAGRF